MRDKRQQHDEARGMYQGFALSFLTIAIVRLGADSWGEAVYLALLCAAPWTVFAAAVDLFMDFDYPDRR